MLLFSILTLLVFFISDAQAAYKLYLKNGKTIQGISSYEKAEGEIRFSLGAGTIGIPEKDVLRIEEYEPEKDEILKEQVPTQKAPSQTPARERGAVTPGGQRGVNLKNKLSDIDKRLEEISIGEKAYQDLKDQLNQVNLRIENLYKKGREAAMARGKSPLEAQQQYQQYLSPEERSMVQMNFLKKHQLEADIQKMEADPVFQADLAEKQRLLDDKKELEGEITNLQTGTTF